jgi:hypothetical protein
VAVLPRRKQHSVRRRRGGGRRRRPVTWSGARRCTRLWSRGRRGRWRCQWPEGWNRHRYTTCRRASPARWNDHVEVLAGEDVPELPRLLLQPGNRLRIGDLPLPIRDLLRQRRILGCECVDLGVEVPRLRHLSVHREGNQSADPGNEHDCNPAQRDWAVDGWTWGATDGSVLFPALSETNGAM